MRTSRRGALTGLGAVTLGVAAGGTTAVASSQEAVVPFELTYNQAWTAVKLDGHGWYKFLIDTGAAFFSIDDGIAQGIALKRRSSEDIVGAVGHRYLNSYIVQDVNIANVVHDANEGMFGMNAHLGGIQGLVPAALLGVVRFDFVQKRMHLSKGVASRPDGFVAVAREGGRTREGSRVKEYGDPRPQIRVTLDGHPLRLWIDTGAQSGLYLFSEYVARSGLWDAYGKPDSQPVEGVTGGGMARYVKAGTLDVGGVKFESPHMSMQDPTERGRAMLSQEGQADGLLGMELLRRLDLVIDPYGSEVFLRPNALFNDVERRNRAGLLVRLVDGKPTAVEVTEGSPAWKAGVRQGDMVVGYAGGDSSVSGLMWLLSGPAGSTVVIELSQSGQTKQVAIVLEDPK